MPYRASELKGKNRCFFRRSRDIQTESSKNEVFDRVVFQKNIIKNFFYSKALRGQEGKVKVMIGLINAGMTKDDVPDEETYTAVKSILKMCGVNFNEEFDERKAFMYVKLASSPKFIEKLIKERYTKMDFETEETAILQAEKTLGNILRYLKQETRTPIIPERKDLDLFGILEVSTRPDLVFIDKYKGTVEAVSICCRKPDVTNRGKKKDGAVNTSLELYALWKYAEGMYDTDPHKTLASYYFLRRNGDRMDKLEEDFFGSDNIVTMSGDLSGKSPDAIFEPQVEEFVMGEECSGDTCDGCDFNDLCNFANTPLKSEEPKAKKSVSDLSLSKAQSDAIYFRKGVARVNAGAGAGKTLVVALRTAFMLDEGIDPEDILLITFTEAGATEMRERIEMYDEDLGNDTDMSRISCMTFNAFGDEIVRKEYEMLGFDKPPRVIDNIERKKIISDLLGKYTISGLDYGNFSMDLPYVKGALAVCEKAFDIIKKNRLSSFDKDELKEEMKKEGLKGSIDHENAYLELLDLYDEYDTILRDRCLIEFADQEKLLFDLLDMDPYYFDKLGYKHITVDEFQDSSENQIELVKKLCESRSFESLMVVGDDSQSIYAFRGACSENIIDFFDILGIDGTDIYITENYRSDPAILDFANKLNAKNVKRVEKDLIPTRTPNGKTPVVKGFNSVKEEYEYIAQVIEDKKKEGIPLDDIAVLAATRSELIKIAGVLTDAGIENVLQAPEPMLENSRVRGLIAFAKAYEDESATSDVLTFVNCMRGGEILKLKDEDIPAEIAKGIDDIRSIKKRFGPYKLKQFDSVTQQIAGEDELANNLLERLKRFPDIDDKIDYLKTFEKFGGEAAKRDGKYSGVVLSTAHSSKGLEWPIVINSVTKYDRKNLGLDATEERRRLMFVSVTRARDELYITGQIKLSGNKKDGYAYNRFVSEAAEIAGVTLDRLDAKGIAKAKSDKAEARKRLDSKKEDAKKKKHSA